MQLFIPLHVRRSNLFLKHYRPRILYNNPENHPKLIPATDFPMKNVLSTIKDTMTKYEPGFFQKYPKVVEKNIPISHTQTGQIVKKVLYGGLFPQSIKLLCDSYGLSVKGKKIDFADFSKYYSKAIIATDLPDYELIIYLRSRQKKEYHKMIQAKDGHFKFERPTPPKVGFFLWLEVIQPTLGTQITHQITGIVYSTSTENEIVISTISIIEGLIRYFNHPDN